MSWPKNPWIFRSFTMGLAFVVLGCGVKGDPLPPEKPVDMGRGRPTYRRATQKIKIDSSIETEDEERN